jgi:hypothetical protein
MKPDAVYCINLDRRTDRWAQCQLEFARLGLPVTRFAALSQPTPTRGLCLSVARILEQAQARNLANVLILEDDVEFVHLEKLHDPPEDFDLYYLGFMAHVVSKFEIVNERWIRLLAHCSCAHAIIYAARIFPTVIAGLRSAAILDDWLDTHIQPRGATYANNPPVALQRNSPSDLSPEPYRQIMHKALLDQHGLVTLRGGQPITF